MYVCIWPAMDGHVCARMRPDRYRYQYQTLHNAVARVAQLLELAAWWWYMVVVRSAAAKTLIHKRVRYYKLKRVKKVYLVVVRSAAAKTLIHKRVRYYKLKKV